MKKFYLALASFLLVFVAQAQLQYCNSSFSANVVATTVNFTSPLPPNAPVSQTWYFGDGSTSNLSNPVHTYPNCGVYTVYHEVLVYDSANVVFCQDSSFQVVTIVCNTPCSAQAFFSAQSVPGTANVFDFINGSTVAAGNPVMCTWNFGDGTFATTQNISSINHSYNASGVYNVCLYVTSGQLGTTNVCRDTFCLTITAVAPAPCPAQASFSWSATPANSSINFINTSTGIAPGDSIIWNFGDGNIGYDLNPVHTYAAPGIYTVCLRIVHNTTGAPPCVSDICIPVNVTATQPCSVLPSFTIQTSPNTNAVIFTNTSAPLGLATWNFGDNTTATGNIVTHVFSQPGTYNVCLHVQVNNTCSADTCGPIVITTNPNPCNLVAHFTTAVAPTPNTISFTNTSVGFVASDSIRWSFGDGTTSYQINPVHTYTTPGTYQVCLWVKKNNWPSGTAPCEAVLCYAVVVGNPCNIQANFVATPVTTTNATYTFSSMNANIPGATYTWSFGDSTGANGPVATHTYAAAGTYQVCLHVATSSTCFSDTCMTITVTGTNPSPCNLNPTFSYQQSPVQPGLFVFTNTTVTANAPLVNWNFGDSTVGVGNVATHIFPAPGTYIVCMRVTVSNTCISDTCITVQVTPPPCNLNAGFTWVSGTASQSMAFMNASTGVMMGDSISWNFGDGTGSNLLNPVHTYSAPGAYTVCLRISKPHPAGVAPCVSEICHNIIVPQTLVAYPNPATSVVNVSVNTSAAGPIYAFLYNAQNVFMSQQIVAGVSGNNTITFNTANLTPGYYTIRLYFNGQYTTARFLKL